MCRLVASRDLRVLIVEDEPYMAEAIRDGLRLDAIAADIAGDGDTALEMLHANTYDIDLPIMMDESQLVAENLGVTKAGEVLVIDPNTRQVLYHGPLDRSVGRGGDGDDGAPRRARPAPAAAGAPAAPRQAPSTPLADVLGKVVAGNYTGPYFDGTTALNVPPNTYKWTGTADQSTSQWLQPASYGNELVNDTNLIVPAGSVLG